MAGELISPSPAVPRLIGKIRPDDDRIRVVGTLKEAKEDGSFILADNTGSIHVMPSATATEHPHQSLEVGAILRIFGTLEISLDGGYLLRGDLLQEFSRIDLELYHKVRAVAEFEVVKM